MPDQHLSEDSVIRSAGISIGWRQSRHVSERAAKLPQFGRALPGSELPRITLDFVLPPGGPAERAPVHDSREHWRYRDSLEGPRAQVVPSGPYQLALHLRGPAGGLVYGGGYVKAYFQLDSMAFSMAFISDSISLI
jgi:hypothetical protein